MKKYQIFDDSTLERIFEEQHRKKKSRAEEDYNDIQYIDMVYPPDSNPPIRNSIKKMTLIGFNPITFE